MRCAEDCVVGSADFAAFPQPETIDTMMATAAATAIGIRIGRFLFTTSPLVWCGFTVWRFRFS